MYRTGNVKWRRENLEIFCLVLILRDKRQNELRIFDGNKLHANHLTITVCLIGDKYMYIDKVRTTCN